MPKKETWSFTKLSAYEQCPYQFYLKYREKRGGADNFYSTFGSLIHELLEKILKKEMTYDEAIEYYTYSFDDVVLKDAPKDTIEKFFDRGLIYLSEVNFDWLDDEFEIVGVEEELYFKIDEYEFVGVIDLLLKNKESGAYVIIDHKSSRYPFGKNGQPLKACLNQVEHYETQLYFYAEAVKQKFGVYPVQLTWNYFREGKWYSIPFDEEKISKSQEWAKNLISQIKKDKAFDSKEDFFYCKNLCDYRDSCEYKLMKDEDESDDTSARSLDI